MNMSRPALFIGSTNCVIVQYALIATCNHNIMPIASYTGNTSLLYLLKVKPLMIPYQDTVSVPANYI